MKYLLVIVLALGVFWLWRIGRQRHNQSAQPPRPGSQAEAEKAITETVVCALCKVHLPQSEALIGRDGFYCSEAHRREAGA